MTAKCQPASDATRDALEKLITKHSGNLSAIARALSQAGRRITRQGVADLIERHGLRAMAAELRTDSVPANLRVQGRRSPLDIPGEVDPSAEREAILSVLARTPNRTAAAKRLRIGRRTLMRRCRDLKITVAMVTAARARDADEARRIAAGIENPVAKRKPSPPSA